MAFQRLGILIVLCAAAMVSQFYRAANSVLADPVMAELGLPPTAYGSMTAAFFLAFMLAQLPSGVLLDRYGPRLTISGLLLFAVAGGLVFAMGDRLGILVVGRVLLGIGCAAVIMGAFVIVSFWFKPRHFAVISSIIVATSHLGNLMATAPLALAVEWVGWRASIAGLAAASLAVAILIFLVVRDAPSGSARQQAKTGWGDMIGGLGSVLKMPDIRRAFALSSVCYASMITILGLWGGPYLRDTFDLSSVAVGRVLLVMPLASLLGALSFGPLDQLYNSRKAAVLTGAVPLGLTLLTLGLLAQPPLLLVTLLLGAIAFFSAAGMLIIAHGRGLLPDHLAGRGITTINTGVIGGAALFQIGSSLLLDGFTDAAGEVAPEGFRLMFGAMGALVLLAVLIYLPARDVRPRQLAPARRT